MKRAFQGRGWRFPLLPDEAGGLPYVEGEANVEQSLVILLQTRLGERWMRPGFGSDAASLVFAPGSLQYLRRLETAVREAVRDWEPRVELDEVRAETDAGRVAGEGIGDGTRVTVSIAYRVRASNTRLNLVFPFYLDTVGSRP